MWEQSDLIRSPGSASDPSPLSDFFAQPPTGLCLPPASRVTPRAWQEKAGPTFAGLSPHAEPPQCNDWLCPRENLIGTGVPLCRMGTLWVGDFSEKRGVVLGDLLQ